MRTAVKTDSPVNCASRSSASLSRLSLSSGTRVSALSELKEEYGSLKVFVFNSKLFYVGKDIRDEEGSYAYEVCQARTSRDRRGM